MKFICVGRNYSEHIRELGNQAPSEPVIFMKPDTALLTNGATFYIPKYSEEAQYEVELIYRVSKAGKHIAPEFVHRYVNAVSLGIDFTLRDVQQQLKEKGLPWERAKAFDGSAAVGTWVEADGQRAVDGDYHFSLKVNGVEKQSGHSSMMLNNVRSLIAYISSFITLKTGDIVFTGTPAGVGKVLPGDDFLAILNNSNVLEIKAL